MQIGDKRREIDGIDRELVAMLNRRAAIAKEISMLKCSAGLPIVDNQREDEILRGLVCDNAGVIEDAALVRIYRTILSESRRIQANVRAELSNGVGK